MPEQTLKIVLTGDGGGLVEVLDDSADGFDEVGESAEKAGKKAKRAGNQLGFVEREARKLFSGTRKLVNGLGGLKTALLGLGVGALVKQFVDAASTSEQLRVRLRVLLGSVAEGNRLFEQMTLFASRVPFEFRNIMAASTTLASVVTGGVGEVVALMPLIGDLAAASGLSIEDTTGQIVRMFSAGAASADLFRERGILAMLGFQAGVTVSAAETKRRVVESWESTNSRFRGATDQLANTWAGGLSMMSDKWFQFRNTVMDAGLFDYLKSVGAVIDEELAAGLDSSKQAAKTWADAIITGMESVAGATGVMADGFHGVRIGFKALELGWQGVQLLLLSGIDVVLTALVNLKTEYSALLRAAEVFAPTSVAAFAIDGLLDTEKLESGRAAIRLWKQDVETSIAAVKGDLDGLATFLPSQQLEKFMERVRAQFELTRGESLALAGAIGEVGDAAGNAGKKTQPLTTEQIAARKATDDLKKSLKFELDQLKRTDREKAVANALRGLSAEQIRLEGDEIERLAGLLFDEEAAIRALTAAEEDRIRDLEKTAEEQAEAFRRPFENALDGIQDAGVDMFEDIFSGGVNSAKDFGRTVKDLFIRLAAELSAAMVIRVALGSFDLQQVLNGGGSGAGGAGSGGSAGNQALNGLFKSGSDALAGWITAGGESLIDASVWLGNQSYIPEFFASGVESAGASASAAGSSSAASGGSSFTSGAMNAGATYAGNAGANALLGDDRGEEANIGGTIGGVIGSYWGAAGAAIGSFFGNAVGGLFGSSPSPPKFHVRGSPDLFQAGTDNDGHARTVEGFGGLGGLQFSAQHIADDDSFLENQKFIDAIIGMDNQIAGLLGDRALDVAQQAAQSFEFHTKKSIDIADVLRSRAASIGAAIGEAGGLDQSIARALTLPTSLEQLAEDLALIDVLGNAAGGASATAQSLAIGLDALDDKFKRLESRAIDLGLPLTKLGDLREAERRQLEQTLGLGGVRDLLSSLTSTESSPLGQMEVLKNANQRYREAVTGVELGDQLSLQQLPGVASNLLNQLQGMFSNGENFFNGLDFNQENIPLLERDENLDIAGFDEIRGQLEQLLGIPQFSGGGVSHGLGFVHANEGVVPLNGGGAIDVQLNSGLITPVVRAIELGHQISAANDDNQADLQQAILEELRINNKLLRAMNPQRAAAR